MQNHINHQEKEARLKLHVTAGLGFFNRRGNKRSRAIVWCVAGQLPRHDSGLNQVVQAPNAVLAYCHPILMIWHFPLASCKEAQDNLLGVFFG